MKQWISPLLAALMLSPLVASLQVGDLDFDVTFMWRVKKAHTSLFNSEVEYAHVNRLFGSVEMYVSNRSVGNEGLESFYEALKPLEEGLLPYATPHWSPSLRCELMGEEEATVSGYPAKKLTFACSLSPDREEMIISYLIARTKKGWFWDSHIGYTISFSCDKEVFHTRGEREMDLIINGVKIV